MKLWNEFIKPIVVLVVICVITSALLGITNSVTAPVIAENAVKAANDVRTALLPAADGAFTKTEIEPVDGVTEVYTADNGAGCVISAEAQGYGGSVPVMVAFGKDGAITAVNFLSNSETPGLGQKVRTEKFGAQFTGMEATSFGLSDIDAISGATISSSAAVTAINAAITAYNQVMGIEQVDLSAMSEEEVLAYVLPDGGALTPVDVPNADDSAAYTAANGGIIISSTVDGFYKKPLTAVVGFDADGTVLGVWFDAKNETEGVGQQVGANEAFAAEFVGQSGTAEADVVAGASVSSGYAIDAVNQAMDYFNAAKEAGLV